MGAGRSLLLFLFLSCVLTLSFVSAGSSSEKIAFHDDFSSGDVSGKWSIDIAGSGNRFSEEDGAAVFETYGSRFKDYRKEHAFLRSRVITIENWRSVTFSGRWKFTDPGTAEMWFRIYDLDSGKYFGMRYISWPSDKIAYDLPGGAVSETRRIPRDYRTFKVVLYPDHVEFWESGELLKNVPTEQFGRSTHFQLVIGGWDDSPMKSHIYFDGVEVSYEPTSTGTTRSQTGTSGQKSSSATGSGKTCGPGAMLFLALLAAVRRR